MKYFGYITRGFIVTTALIWVLYDIFIYFTAGNPGTESATLWRWAYQLASLDFCFGALVAHLFCEYRAPSATEDTMPDYVSVSQGVIFVTSLTWLGWDAWYAFIGLGSSPVTTAVWAACNHQTWIVLILGGIVGRVYFQMWGPTSFS